MILSLVEDLLARNTEYVEASRRASSCEVRIEPYAAADDWTAPIVGPGTEGCPIQVALRFSISNAESKVQRPGGNTS